MLRALLVLCLPMALISCAGSKDSQSSDSGQDGLADLDDDGYAEDVDCDDSDAAVHPGALDDCDGVDDDCDGTTDEDGEAELLGYTDGDGDGYGDPNQPVQGCEGGYAVADATDCDDADAEINPLAVEICDGLDNDCSGEADDGPPADSQTWHPDADADGYGSADESITACEAPEGWIEDGSDCADEDAAQNPLAEEICDGLDNDCDGDTDPADSTDASTWYVDADGDGYGDETLSELACEQPKDTVDNGDDCDDTDATVTSCPTHIGQDTEFSESSSHAPNYLLGNAIEVPSDCTLTHLALIGKKATGNVVMALYTDSGGPDALVASTDSTPMVVGPLEMPTAETELVAGTYWIMAIYDVTASVGIEFTSSDVVDYRSYTFSTSMPDPFGSYSTYSGQLFNYYMVVE